jgi:hypothetical protein
MQFHGTGVPAPAVSFTPVRKALISWRLSFDVCGCLLYQVWSKIGLKIKKIRTNFSLAFKWIMTCNVLIFHGIQNLSAFLAWQSSVLNYVRFGLKSVENTDRTSSKAINKIWLWAGIAQSV